MPLNHIHQKIVHANALVMFNHGIFITGGPGIGKSQLSIGLISRGHKIIADDAVLLSDTTTGLYAQAPQPTINLVYQRDQGIIPIKETYGEHTLQSKHLIHLHISLNETNNLSPHMQRKPYQTWLLKHNIPSFRFSLPKEYDRITKFELWVQKKIQYMAREH